MNILVVEDGHEYIELCARFGASVANWSRVGSGEAALAALEFGGVDGVLLDVCFRRLAVEAWLSPIPGQERWVGSSGSEQGIVILQHVRAMYPSLPVVLALDPRLNAQRWLDISARYGPVAALGSPLHPTTVVASLRSMIRPGL
jgi:CheY-like chemotaxis protein